MFKIGKIMLYSSAYAIDNSEEGISLAERLLEFGGLGHSAVIHSQNKDTILKFSKTLLQNDFKTDEND